MKNGVKKPRTRAPAKKRRLKKLKTVDKIHAAIVAALIIAAVGLGSFAVMYFRSAAARTPPQITELPPVETTVEQKPEALPVELEPVRPAPKAPEPEPASSTPVVENKATPPVENKATPPVENKATPPVENKATPPVENKAAPPAPPTGAIIERPPVSRGTLAFVIDDAGYNLHELEPFLKLDIPLTIAVLPGLTYSVEAARRIRAAGKELILHQPMEALGGQDPGPLAIRIGMNRDEIRSIITRNLDEIGPVAGINNHEGSRVTMDAEVMETVLALCRERGILFLDSRTTADTAAPNAARRLGMSIGERDVFVDNVQERESMIAYINTGLARAEQKGAAILIGHVWSAELAPLLANLTPGLKERGYSFSPLSKVINR